jgi:hypothetical protein
METQPKHAPVGAAWSILHLGASRCLSKGCDKFAPFCIFRSLVRKKGQMNFDAFWKWLLGNNGLYNNLGGKGAFEIETINAAGTCTPQSTKKKHPFSKNDAKLTWDRYWSLPLEQRHMAGRYVDGPQPHNWNPCPNRYCCPWIAATIRDFISRKLSSTVSTAVISPGVNKDKKTAIGSYCACKVWQCIQNTRIYRNPISLPPMDGRAANLFFQYDHDHRSQQIHVWRANGLPDFWINAADFHTICRRYHFCLQNNLVPANPNQMGGTAQFNNPNWPNPPLGQNDTPYVPPIIRHVFQNSPRLMNIQPCC